MAKIDLSAVSLTELRYLVALSEEHSFSKAAVSCGVSQPTLSEAIKKLEAIVHPLVAEERDAFLKKAAADGIPVVVLDIPLLFEIGAERLVDAVVVVTAPETVQKSRVLVRPGMTPERFEAIVARQIPDAEKRRRAHFIIDTSNGFEAAGRDVDTVLRAAAYLEPAGLHARNHPRHRNDGS